MTPAARRRRPLRCPWDAVGALWSAQEPETASVDARWRPAVTGPYSGRKERRMSRRTVIAVVGYLAAIVAANLLAATYGPAASIPVAFVLVALDLTTRDLLHDAWRGRWLPVKMGALIAAGSGISWLLNAGAGRVAVASTASFTVAALVDAVVYHAARPRLQRINLSNIPAAAVDSLVFPTVAFGAVLPWVVAGQFAAKFAGGLLWAWLLTRPTRSGVAGEAPAEVAA